MSRPVRRIMLELHTRAESLAFKVRPLAHPVAASVQRIAQHPFAVLLLAIVRPLAWLALLLAPFYYLKTLYDAAWEFMADKNFHWVWQRAFPLSRTWLILSMYVVPKWATHMAAVMLAWAVLHWLVYFIMSRTVSRGYLPLATSENGHANGHAYTHSVTELEPMLPPSADDVVTSQRRGVPAPPLLGKPTARRRIFSLWNLTYWAVFLGYCAIALFGWYIWETREPEDISRYKDVLNLAVREPRPQGYGKRDKVMIGAMFYNSHDILPNWLEQMTKVIHYIGVENVYVSVFESFSEDDTPDILEEWERELNILGVPNRILTRSTRTTRPENMRTELPRIKFLADSRNIVLEPLTETGGGWDYIIYSNDIFIDAEGVIELLHSRDGDYDMVCAFDYAQWGVTDGWVMRDRLGGMVSGIWPYLMERHGAAAVMRHEPAQVFSCWNGIVSMRADIFVPPVLRNKSRIESHLSSKRLLYTIPETHPARNLQHLPPAEMPPLKFRVSEGEECFSSECFLIPYDMQRQYGLRGIYMNPRVVSTYIWDHHIWFGSVLRHWLVRWWIETVEFGRGYTQPCGWTATRRTRTSGMAAPAPCSS
ncbi:cryptococcal mannosyltransferase 1-domain-containing protein [Auriculariales sp. MPI-PUGE-AT-0066]|nr:cryptococcal mannosyltransferase 1-domain-containing protein [Auriculariales sp. MPI-PUGE-AT-0066]